MMTVRGNVRQALFCAVQVSETGRDRALAMVLRGELGPSDPLAP